MKAHRRSSAPPDVPTLFAQWKDGTFLILLLLIIVFYHGMYVNVILDRAVQPNKFENIQESDSEPCDYDSEPSTPPESDNDSEPEGDPPTDPDGTPPDSEFEDDLQSFMDEDESFVDGSFLDESLIDESDESFIDDDDGIIHKFTFDLFVCSDFS